MLKTPMEKILICGSGLTGAITACLLKHDKAQISLWDKANGYGGRMSTSRNPKDSKSTVDLGAQYISATPDNQLSHKRFYDELRTAGVLTPLAEIIEQDENAFPIDFPEGTKHFMTPSGVSSIVQHYIKKSGVKVCYSQRITDISEADGKWKVVSESGQSSLFDSVVLTMPVPQILQLRGSISQLIDSQPEIKEKLEKVSYSSRYALGLFYDPGTEIDVPWCGKYFSGEPCVRFVAIDSKKRGLKSKDIGPTVTVHASAPFSIQHLEEDMNDICTKIILPVVQRLIPQLPEPTAVKNHKWRYSQVHNGYEGNPGAIVLKKKPLLMLAGDGFTRSRFDGCVESALKAEELFNELLNSTSSCP